MVARNKLRDPSCFLGNNKVMANSDGSLCSISMRDKYYVAQFAHSHSKHETELNADSELRENETTDLIHKTLQTSSMVAMLRKHFENNDTRWP